MKITSKLHLLTSTDFLRPAMMKIQLKDEFFAATNGHILARIHIDMFGINDAAANSMLKAKFSIDKTANYDKSPQPRYINRFVWGQLRTYDDVIFLREKIVAIKCHKSGTAYVTFSYDKLHDDERFPEYLHIIEEARAQKMQKEYEGNFGINGKNMALMQDAFEKQPNGWHDQIKVWTTGQNKAILVSPNNDAGYERLQEGIVMPVMMNWGPI